jgi:hypothetical protein
MFQHKDGTYVTSLDSVSEFVEQAMLPCNIPHNAVQAQTEKGSTLHKNWHGMSGTFEDLSRVMREGDQEGADKVRDMADGLSVPLLDSIRRRPQWADQGEEVCMDRVRGGQLDVAWRRPSRRMINMRPNVHLVVDYCENGSMDAACLSLRGAACLALADLLNAAGYNVKISGYQAGRNAPMSSVEFLTIKDYQSPMDVASLSSVVCLTAFFRVIGFMKIIKTADDTKQPVADGYGHARHLTNKELLSYGLVGANEHLITVPNWQSANLNKAREWLSGAILAPGQEGPPRL